ncbi:MAG: PKD domain-containing protein [Bacteroidota bacterium]
MKKLIVTFLVYTFGLSKLLAEPPKLHFIENKGQWGSEYSFSAEITGGKFFLEPTVFNFLFYDTKSHERKHGVKDFPEGSAGEHQSENLQMHFLKVSFEGAQAHHVSGIEQLPTHYNYFYGNDPANWIGKAKSFNRVSVCDLYQGVDLEVYSNSYAMKYDLVVRPYTSPESIKMAYEGHESIYLDQGNLHIKTSVNEIQELQPYAYQIVAGKKKKVSCYFKLVDNKVSFEFPLGYDKSLELVIDPILIFSTYSGSPADNWGNTATFGENGKLYSGGITNHFGNNSEERIFPATPGAFQTTWGGLWDVAIFKYDSAGIMVEYATYLGGSDVEVPHSIIMNSRYELVIYGTTGSNDFPVTNGAYQTMFMGGATIQTTFSNPYSSGSDSFIAILSEDGSELVASTFFGGDSNDGISPTSSQLTKNYGDEHRGEVFLDTNDNVLVAGTTSSQNLFDDIDVSFNKIYQGGATDGFIIELSDDLTHLNWGGYLGGSMSDVGLGTKVDATGNVYVTGGTNSPDFTLPMSAVDGSYNGGIDGWIVKVYNTGGSIITGTFVGTAQYDQCYFIDLDSDGGVYVYGQTDGVFPNTTGTSLGNGQFVQKYDADISSTVFSFTFGGSNGNNPNISPTAFLVNDCDNLYLAGWGNDRAAFRGNNYLDLTSQGLPTTSDALKTTSTGQDFYLMVMDANASNLLYATFLGNDSAFVHVDGGTSRFDKSGIVYHSVCASCNGSSTFPTTPGAHSTVNASGGGCNNASFKFDLASLRADFITNTIGFDNPGVSVVCLGDPVVFENRSIGGQQFEWDFGDGSPGITRQDTAFVVHNYNSIGNYTIRLRAFDPNTCISEDFAFRTVQIIDPILFVMDDRAICFGDELRLQASGAQSYSWISEDSTFTSNERTPLIQPEVDTRYFVTLGSGGCFEIDTVDIRVIPEIVVDFSVSRKYDCWTRPTIEVINNNPGQDAQFLWSFGDGTTSLEDNFVHNYENDGTYIISLSAQNEFCLFNENLQVDITTIRVPNIITPTVEGDNDTFIIEAPDRVVLRVYSEWGRLVLEDEDYQNTWAGADISAGVYYYEAQIENETTCKGWVQVLK